MRFKYLFLAQFLFVSQLVIAQTNEAQTTFPSFRLLKTDSTTWFYNSLIPKNRPVLLYYFSPECPHCKEGVVELLARIEELKHTTIIMASYFELRKIKEFESYYGLNRYKNIIIGQELAYRIPVHFQIKSLPFIATFNKDIEPTGQWTGIHPFAEIIPALRAKPAIKNDR